VISAGIKIASVTLIGAPALAVFIFEIVLNGCAMFNHSNVSIPTSVDKILRLFLVTPDMHRVHHSVIPNETNSNFGFNLPYWDRLMGTYIAQPRGGHDQMKVGLSHLRSQKVASLLWLMVAPFYEHTGHYTINAKTDDRN
ncbi:MAG: sterol desaturase family protein, partial [Bdellovibrionota bacterium]